MIIHVILQNFYAIFKAGSRAPVASRIENFVTKINGFQPLVIVTGELVSYFVRVLYPLL